MKSLIITPNNRDKQRIYRNLHRAVCLTLNIDIIEIRNKGNNYFLSDDFQRSINEADVILIDITDENPEFFFLIGRISAFGNDKIIFTSLKSNSQIRKYANYYDIFFYDEVSFESSNKYFSMLKEKILDIISNTPNAIITNFYNSISQKKYYEAWGKISASFKNRRFKEGYKVFELGYSNTQVIDIHNIIPVERNKRYLVLYSESSKAPFLKGLENLNRKRVYELTDIILEINN